MGLFDGLIKLFRDAPQTKPVTGEAAVANLSTLGYFGQSGTYTAYNPNELISRRGYQIIDRMRLDEQVKAAMTFKKRTVNATGWSVQSPEDKPHDWDVTVFVENALRNMRGTLDQSINEMLTALDYGFSITEKLWEKTDSGLVIAELKTRRPHDFTFDLDAFGNIAALRQNNDPLPADKFVLLTYDREFQNPYGVTDLAAAYRPWWSKDNAYKWLAMLLERMGIPPIFMFYNPGSQVASNIGDLQTILKRLQASTVATIPRANKDDVEPWAPELANNATNVFIPSIDMYDRHIAKAVLMPGLLGFSADEAQGSLARSQTHFDSFLLVVSAIRSLVEQVAIQEQIIKPMVDLNFAGVDDYPQFKFLPINDQTRLDIFTTWRDLINGKVVKATDDDEKFIRESLKFPERDYTEGERDAMNTPPPPPTFGQPQPDGMDAEAKDGNAKEQAPAKKDFAATKHEKRIDYKALASSMDAVEAQLKDGLAQAIDKARAKVEKWIKANYTGKDFDPSAFELPAGMNTRKVFAEAFAKAAQVGAESARADVPNGKKYDRTGGATRPKVIPGETTKAAAAYLKTKSRIVADKFDARLADAAKQALLTGFKTGDSVGEITSRVMGALDSEDSLYAETVVRTNITDAVNTARLAEFRDPDLAAFIVGIQYSAIIDSRTTDVCDFLHGKIFRSDDSALDEFTPPNHFNCRSVLVPVFVDEAPSDDEYISESEKGEARDLVSKGFI